MESDADKPPRSALATTVYRLHLEFLRRVNDSVVFLSEVTPLLVDVRDEFAKGKRADVRKFAVPGADGAKTSKRTPEQLRGIFDRFISRELAETFLVTAVSQFESYVFGVLREIIKRYPKKLTVTADGQAGCRQFSLELLLRAHTIEDAIAEVIEHRLVSVSYAKPRDYLRYFKTVAGVDTEDSAFADYIEIKATRDIIVHNGGVANELYQEKAGDKKRAERGDSLPVDEAYFEHVIATLKRCSGIISRDIDAGFPERVRRNRL